MYNIKTPQNITVHLIRLWYLLLFVLLFSLQSDVTSWRMMSSTGTG